MKSRTLFFLACISLVFASIIHLKPAVLLSKNAPVVPPILIDQFGYRLQDPKIAVIQSTSAQPKLSRSKHYSVRDIQTGKTVYSGIVIPWNQGNVHSQSGDVVGWFDFSSVTQPGQYTIQSDTGEKSFPFEIANDVYRKVLIAAVRMYFYQRSGFPKRFPYADARWQDEAAFLGPHQDTEARFVGDKQNSALEKDMRGGWFDAGDTNKYVTFAAHPVNQLLHAYTQNPTIWTDDFNIPESNNGIPDLIDEIKFELDWLSRMQDGDGGVFIKLGTLDYNYAQRPSLDKRPRFYGPKCSSATIALAGMFSHAALVFEKLPRLTKYANDLRQKASKAWEWFESHPIEVNCDTQEIKAGDADKTLQEQLGDAVAAATYLFALTGESKYTDYVQAHLAYTQPFLDDVWSRYQPTQGDSLLFYTRLPKADRSLKKRIIERLEMLIRSNPSAYGDAGKLDPYRAYMPDEQYHWGSNCVKANYGNSNYDVALYKVDLPKDNQYTSRALDTIHYLHGVNPMKIVYISNMSEYGAEYSASEMWHEWFGKGIYSNALTSPNGPAPGYITGGPNKSYTGSAPLRQQPPMKAYLDSNNIKLRMWEVTEPSITYQGAYIKLLSKFVND
jgi:hypothetical protein